jgi:hypothetical protein
VPRRKNVATGNLRLDLAFEFQEFRVAESVKALQDHGAPDAERFQLPADVLSRQQYFDARQTCRPGLFVQHIGGPDYACGRYLREPHADN